MLRLVEEGGASISLDNIAASTNGAKSFMLDTTAGNADYVVGALSLNDGAYGDAKCWIGQTTGNGGIVFTRLFKISMLAFGRDNSGALTDNFTGVFTLQYTATSVPLMTMGETGDPRTGWATLGILEYLRAGGSLFQTPWRRHVFKFTPTQATAIRLLVFDGKRIDLL